MWFVMPNNYKGFILIHNTIVWHVRTFVFIARNRLSVCTFHPTQGITEPEGGHPILLCNFYFYFLISYSTLNFLKKYSNYNSILYSLMEYLTTKTYKCLLFLVRRKHKVIIKL